MRSAAEFVSSFNDTFGAICANVLRRGGREVQYARIRADPSWRVYLAHVAEAAHVTDWADLPPPARLAFLFNVYNGLVLHAKLVFGHPSTLATRGAFFNTAAYVLGGRRYSLVVLEHGLLRRKALSGGPGAAAPPPSPSRPPPCRRATWTRTRATAALCCRHCRTARDRKSVV